MSDVGPVEPVEDPVAAVDALVAEIGPAVASPPRQHRGAVLVTGPWLAGVSAVAAALADRLPGHTFVESTDLAPGDAPVAVVFVVSAAAALTGSDCALLDAAATDTEAVIGVVSKIDVHRDWRDTLAHDRDTLPAHSPRYRTVPWIGVAAAPGSGQPRVDELVAAVVTQLADPDVARRNRLRTWESRLHAVVHRYDRDVDGAGRHARVAVLEEQRRAMLRERRLAKSQHTVALRSQLQQARVQLSYFARNRAASVRTELAEDTSGLGRDDLPGFEPRVRSGVAEVVAEVDAGITVHLADVAHRSELAVTLPAGGELPPVAAAGPPLKSRRTETRLMMLLGAGFGLGVALSLGRLFADLTPGLTAGGLVACVAVGLAVTVWVVSTRGLLHDRAMLDRWVGEVTASLRAATEQLVASRVLTAEAVLTAALSEQQETAGAQVADRVRQIDAELREHAVAGARAAAAHDRQTPTLRRALAAVRAELGEPETDGEPINSHVYSSTNARRHPSSTEQLETP